MDSHLIQFVGLGALLAFAAFMGWYDRRAGRRSAAREEAWSSAAKALGLKYDQGEGRTLSGRIDGFDVLLESFDEGTEQSPRPVTRATVGGRDRIRREVCFKAEAAFEGLRKALGKDDLQLDDPEFDKAVNVHGPEDVALSSLGAQARQALVRLTRAGGSVQDGEVALRAPGELTDARALQDLVKAVLDAARALAVDSVPAALLSNAKSDPNPRVRLKNLGALATRHAGTSEARLGLEAGLADADPEVRLLAARLGDARPETRRALEKLVEDGRLAAELRAGALERLAEAFPYAEVAPLVRKALAQTSAELRRAAVAAAGAGRDSALLDAADGLLGSGDEALAATMAKALASVGGSKAETALIALLGNASSAVRCEAAAGLGRSGTVRAVEPLLPLTEGVLADGALKQVARDAVRAIQARLGDAGEGRLSVVQEVAEQGALSVDERAAEGGSGVREGGGGPSGGGG